MSRPVRLQLASNANQKLKALFVIRMPLASSLSSPTSTEFRTSLLQHAKNKLRIKKPTRVFLASGEEAITDIDLITNIRDDSIVLISAGENFIGAATHPTKAPAQSKVIEPSAGAGPTAERPTTTTFATVEQPDKPEAPRRTARQPTHSCKSGTVILIYPDAATLSSALSRANTSYEGAELRGPLRGANMPITSFLKFCDGLQDSGGSALEEDEKHVREVIKEAKLAAVTAKVEPPCYLIAAVKADRPTLAHEWAHARFYVDEDYRAQCVKVYDTLDEAVRAGIIKELIGWNYQPAGYVDEFQAYVVEDAGSFGEKWRSALKKSNIILKVACGPPPQQ
ncbi:hypothetical protein HK101_008393 [Irineochytrium annulatum]|nr:hypothetical protein HK101_008393 [Irineochytrium annulatum]